MKNIIFIRTRIRRNWSMTGIERTTVYVCSNVRCCHDMKDYWKLTRWIVIWIGNDSSIYTCVCVCVSWWWTWNCWETNLLFFLISAFSFCLFFQFKKKKNEMKWWNIKQFVVFEWPNAERRSRNGGAMKCFKKKSSLASPS